MKIDINKINKIRCSSCKAQKGVRPDVLKARLKKAGVTLDELLATYICRQCTKGDAVKNNDTNKKQKDVVPIDGFWSREDYSFKKESKSLDGIAELTSRMCLMPVLCIEHACETCPYYSECACTDPKGNLYKSLVGTKIKRKKKRK